MRLVSTSTMVKELEQKVQDCEERLKTSGAAEKRALEEECEKYRQLIAIAKSKMVLW